MGTNYFSQFLNKYSQRYQNSLVVIFDLNIFSSTKPRILTPKKSRYGQSPRHFYTGFPLDTLIYLNNGHACYHRYRSITFFINIPVETYF